MTILRVQVLLPRETAIPQDSVMNTWHFLTVGAASSPDAADEAVLQLGQFYGAIDGLLASYLGANLEMKVYDLSDVEPRVPILNATSAINSGAGSALPGEVAICLSYRGSLVSGTNPARRRGRIFIGPLDDAVGELLSGDMAVTASARGTIANAAEDLANAGLASDARWVVFSPTLAGTPPWESSQLEDASADVVAGYVDNAFDTVRSRGADPTLRSLFEITPP